MRMNKHGWGLVEMLVLSGVLILFLFIAIYFIYNFYGALDKEVSVTYYNNLEDKLKNQVLVYLNDYYDGTLNSDNITIKRSVLKAYNLDVNLNDKNGNACSGYAIANKSKAKINVNTYISCDNYETNGYEDWRK